MTGECFDDGDVGGPTSHRYLYEMDRENLFALFVGAVASLTVSDAGARCLSAEAQALSRLARTVQARADASIAREDRLARLATVTRVLLSYTDNRDRGRESEWDMPMPELVAYFLRLRAELGDMLPTPNAMGVPDDLSGLDELPDEVSEGEDIVTEEGGYLWHTDGRDPEAVA